MLARVLLLAGALAFGAGAAHAATGCSLRNPHTDIRRFFPEYTDFVVQYLTFARQDPGGSAGLARALGDALDPLFESEDVPYTLYTVRQGGRTLGYVYGTNQRGKHGNLQVIAVTDAAHRLQDVYLQTLRSPHRDALLDEAWLARLSAVPLEAWRGWSRCYAEDRCEGVPVPDPTGGLAAEDHRAILRALAKLGLLRERLLHPGAPPPPRDGAALAESIGNHEAMELSRETAEAWGFAPLARGGLAPDAPVVLTRTNGRTVAWPAEALRKVPVVRDGELLLVWSETTGTASALRTDRALVPTADLLFDVRLLRDAGEGGTWSPPLARAVAGPAAHADAVAALVVPAGVAAQAAPWAALWTGAPAPPARAAIEGPRALLVDRRVVPLPEPGGVRVEPTGLVVQAEGELAWALVAPDDRSLAGLRLQGERLVHADSGRSWTRLGRALHSADPAEDLTWPVQALMPEASAKAHARP
jgi:hypothetical protein